MRPSAQAPARRKIFSISLPFANSSTSLSRRTPQITPFTNTRSGCSRGALAKNCSKFVPAATSAFFDLHLKSDATAAQRLTVEGLRPLLRGEINAVEVLRKDQTK